MDKSFDLEKALKELQSGKPITGKGGVLTPLIKQLTEATLNAELVAHLDDDEQPNRKNGTTAKTIKSSHGNFELNTPRDHAGSFEPQIIKKHQTTLTDEIETKILSLFSWYELPRYYTKFDRFVWCQHIHCNTQQYYR